MCDHCICNASECTLHSRSLMSFIGRGGLQNNGSIPAHGTRAHATYIIGDASVDQVTDELHDAAVGISVVQRGGRDGALDYVDDDGAAEESDGTALDKPEARGGKPQMISEKEDIQ